MFILGYEPTKKMLENISKINYLCDIKEVWKFCNYLCAHGVIIIITSRGPVRCA